MAATQAHINTACSHPAMLYLRILLKLDIDMHFLTLRHTVDLPPNVLCRGTLVGGLREDGGHLERQMVSIENSTTKMDSQLLADILIEHPDKQVPQKEYISAMYWL